MKAKYDEEFERFKRDLFDILYRILESDQPYTIINTNRNDFRRKLYKLNRFAAIYGKTILEFRPVLSNNVSLTDLDNEVYNARYIIYLSDNRKMAQIERRPKRILTFRTKARPDDRRYYVLIEDLVHKISPSTIVRKENAF